KHRHFEAVLFINTLLQRGVGVWWRGPNRFSGLRQGRETVEIETVMRLRPAQNTPLKQGVNEKMRNENHLVRAEDTFGTVEHPVNKNKREPEIEFHFRKQSKNGLNIMFATSDFSIWYATPWA